MSVTLTRFELLLPQYADGTPQNAAVQQFLASLNSTAMYFISQTSEIAAGNAETQGVIVWGALTATQATAALGYLNTLNAALGITVPCISWSVQTQP